MKNKTDKQYLELINEILENGVIKGDRTGTGTISIFDWTMRFKMSEGFPLLTSKKMFTKGVIHELIWFLRGDTNIKYLLDNDVHIWDGDCYKSYQGRQLKSFPKKDTDSLSKDQFIDKIKTDDDFAKNWGNLGKIYGYQWRNWTSLKFSHELSSGYVYVNDKVDQIKNLIDDLKNNPDSRRLMVSAWNPSELRDMILPPCHYGFQCYTSEMTLLERKSWWVNSISKNITYSEDLTDTDMDNKGVPKRKLSLKWNQRSVDVGLGLPFNIASYGLLLHLLAREVNMIPNELIFSGGDCHIYLNHVDKLKEQLYRETFELPRLILNNNSIDDVKFEDIQIIDYKSSDTLKMSLSN